MIVRNLILGEQLPPELVTGYEQGQCDPKWIWICEDEGKPVGILVTAPAHIAVILLRLAMTEQAPNQAAGQLLAQSFEQMAARGYRGYMVFIGEKTEVEGQLLRLVKGTGGGVIEETMSLCYGWFDKREAA